MLIDKFIFILGCFMKKIFTILLNLLTVCLLAQAPDLHIHLQAHQELFRVKYKLMVSVDQIMIGLLLLMNQEIAVVHQNL